MKTPKMRKRKSNWLTALALCQLLLVVTGNLQAQIQTLSKDEFINIVKAYHPIVRLSDINIDKAKAGVQNARGVFDPSISSAVRQKELKGDLYYSYFNSEITIPTWYGIDVKAGTERAEGKRLDPEKTVGEVGYVGVKFSLNSILYDKRRAMLQQAQLFRTMTEAEKKLAVNELIYEGLSAYWMWVKEYESLQVISSQLERTNERLMMVRGEIEQGARPAIDTVEAYAQYYTLQQQQKNAEQLWKNASLELSSYLWLDNGMPYTLTQSVMPEQKALNQEQKTVIDMGEMIAKLTTHPKLQMMDSKLDILELDRKLKIQNLIPKLYVNSAVLDYNPYTNSILKQTPADNYKLSVDVSVPLLMREARGGIKAANLKIKEVQTDRLYQLNQLNVKVNSYYNEYVSLTDQIKNYENVRTAYTTLYNGEVVRYTAGESTLFLVNSRELKMLEAAQKLIELKAKQQKAYAGILYAAGILM